jgi:hypothetical protein
MRFVCATTKSSAMRPSDHIHRTCLPGQQASQQSPRVRFVNAGATEWPVCDATEAAVRAAFARGLPTEAERSRIAAKPTGGGRMRIEKRQQARMQQREQERRASGKSGRRKKSRATQVAGVGAGHDGLRPDGGVKKTWRKGKGKNAAASK